VCARVRQPNGNVAFAYGCAPAQHGSVIWASNTDAMLARQLPAAGPERLVDAAQRAAAAAAAVGGGFGAGALALVPSGRGGLALVHEPTGRVLWRRGRRRLPAALRPWPIPW
jgi:hypothetical protein